MSRDERPIGELLDDDLGEPEIQHLWQRTAPQLVRRKRSLAPVFGGAVVLASAAALWLWLSRGGGDENRFLTLESGQPPLPVAATARETLSFSDGSRVVLSPGARLVPRANDARLFALSLESGRARFEVEPGGARRWEIAAGDVTVEVVGTIFTVEHVPERVRVSVERGSVRVDGRGRTRHLLRAGDSLSLPSARDRSEARAHIEPAHEEAEAIERPAQEVRRASWRALAQRGRHRDAWRELGSSGIRDRARVAAPSELLLLADVARLSGHPAEAVPPLERLLAAHARSREAPLAALVLGRLELHQLAHPARAARAFERAIALGVPSAFDEEARASLAIALGRSGDAAGARRAAARYFELHPNGVRANRVREWREER